jgi:hypothetical protein
VNSSAALPTGRRVHLAVTQSGTTATLYVDGLVHGVKGDKMLTPAQLGPTPNNWIGWSQFEADAGFNVRIDDFRIWRSPLAG